jgi:DNA-binding NarL/FixJ family response regulator
MHRVLIVEPHPMARFGLAETLKGESDLEICAQVGSFDEAIQAIDATEPDAVILSLHLPSSCGLTLTHELLSRRPELRVVSVSKHGKPLCAERALRAGALGFVTTEDSGEEIIRAVRAVLQGRYYVCERINGELLRAIAEHPQAIISSPIESLSERELELFELMGAGLSTHEIAERMNLSVKTVETYRARTKVKLKVDDTAELARRAALWVSETRVCLLWKGCLPARKVAAEAEEVAV